MNPDCNLEREDCKPIINMTLWLTMMYQHTTCNDVSTHQVWLQNFNCSEYIIWTNIPWHLNLCCDLDLECSASFFHTTLRFMMVSDKSYRRNSHILIICALAVTLTLKIANQFSAWHTVWQYVIIASLVMKGWAAQEILPWQNPGKWTAGKTDRWIHGHMDTVIPIYAPTLPLCYRGVGGWGWGYYINSVWHNHEAHPQQSYCC